MALDILTIIMMVLGTGLLIVTILEAGKNVDQERKNKTLHLFKIQVAVDVVLSLAYILIGGLIFLSIIRGEFVFVVLLGFSLIKKGIDVNIQKKKDKVIYKNKQMEKTMEKENGEKR